MKNFKRKFLKANKGITLVALIVTIIVLLILAGVAIATLMGNNGIINRTSDAKTKNRIAGAQEEVELAIQALRIDKISKNLGGTLAAYILETENQAEFKKAIGSNDVTFEEGFITYKNIKFEIDSNGTIKGYTEVSGVTQPDEPQGPNDGWSSDIDSTETAKIIANGMTVLADANVPSNLRTSNVKAVIAEGNIPIPAGYYYVEGTSDSGTLPANGSYGVVIADAASNGNEWVWVPVEDATTMYTTHTGYIPGTTLNSTNAWKIYDASADDNAPEGAKDVYTSKMSKSEILTDVTRDEPDTTDYREPAILSDYDTNSDYYSQAKFSSASAMAQAFVDDYDAMIESITKYGGFYVGRYELSAVINPDADEGNGSIVNDDGTINNPMVQKGKTPAASVTWYKLYNACQKFNKASTTSTMMWGCQWDVITNWIGNPSDDENRHTSGRANTGANGNDKFKNIYDLEGNCYEWTQEADDTYGRAYRGGDYTDDDYYTVSYRSDYNPHSAYSHNSSRPTLYIK